MDIRVYVDKKKKNIQIRLHECARSPRPSLFAHAIKGHFYPIVHHMQTVETQSSQCRLAGSWLPKLDYAT